MDEKIKNSITRQFKAIFPNTVNHYDTLFGGTALSYMDEVAFITATRFARMKMVKYLLIRLILVSGFLQVQ